MSALIFENSIIQQASEILMHRMHNATISLRSPEVVLQFLTHKMILEEREIFGALWLNVKLRLITCENVALGTLTQASVYPREVLKSALKHNAASVIFFHNHPTGDIEPSFADHLLTKKLRQALELVEVKILDHFIVAGGKTYSFREHGDL